jgi:hypothetical protein
VRHNAVRQKIDYSIISSALMSRWLSLPLLHLFLQALPA